MDAAGLGFSFVCVDALRSSQSSHCPPLWTSFKAHVLSTDLNHCIITIQAQNYVNKMFQRKFENIFLPMIFSICFGCSKEPSQREGSFEYPQHMFWSRNKEISFLLHTLN